MIDKHRIIGIVWRAALVAMAVGAAGVGHAANTAPPVSTGAAVKAAREADQLAEIRQMMQAAQQQLATHTAGPAQVDLQQQIVRRLEDLLRGGGGGSASGASSGGDAGSRPADDRAAAGTPHEAPSGAGSRPPATAGPGRLPPWWGKLPPAAQGRLESAFPQQFLPAYEDQIRAYYRRLAEEQGLGGP